MSDIKDVEDIELLVKERMKWFTYKGKEILLDDYSNLNQEVFLQLIYQITDLTFKSGKTDILLIVDVTHSFANKEIIKAFKESGKRSKPILNKTAVLGITGVKKILLNVVNKFTGLNAKVFSTMEEAKEWLVA